MACQVQSGLVTVQGGATDIDVELVAPRRRRAAAAGSRCARRSARRARGKCKGPVRRRGCGSRRRARTNRRSTSAGIGAPSAEHAEHGARVARRARSASRIAPGRWLAWRRRVVEQVDEHAPQVLGIEHHADRLARQLDPAACSARRAGSPAACAHSPQTSATCARGVDRRRRPAPRRAPLPSRRRRCASAARRSR